MAFTKANGVEGLAPMGVWAAAWMTVRERKAIKAQSPMSVATANVRTSSALPRTPLSAAPPS